MSSKTNISYTSQEKFELEQERIFERSWVCVGRSDWVSEPGNFLRAEVGRESVLVVRGRDGELFGLLNLCRHRGARLCRLERGQFGRSIRCIYHAWTYGLDGRLIAVPNVREMPAQEMDELNLHRFAVTEWLGYIWVNLDEKAPALADQVNPQLLTRFGDLGVLPRYGTEDLQVTTTVIYDVQANWKLILENFSECYHCPNLHPELTAALPIFRSGYGSVSGPVGQGAQLADVMEGFSLSGQATAPRLPGLTPEDARTFHGVVLRPNVALALVPDHVAFYRLHPQSPGHTRVIVDWLFHPEASSLPEFDPSDAVELLDRANRQDFEACERCQLGAPSKYFTSTLVPHEYVIAELRDWFEAALTPANGQVRGDTRSSADVSLVHPVS